MYRRVPADQPIFNDAGIVPKPVKDLAAWPGRVCATEIWWTGGYTYLDRPVPLYRSDGPSRLSGKYNYVIARAGSVPRDQVVAIDGKQVLARLPVSHCTPDPAYGLNL